MSVCPFISRLLSFSACYYLSRLKGFFICSTLTLTAGQCRKIPWWNAKLVLYWWEWGYNTETLENSEPSKDSVTASCFPCSHLRNKCPFGAHWYCLGESQGAKQNALESTAPSQANVSGCPLGIVLILVRLGWCTNIMGCCSASKNPKETNW